MHTPLTLERMPGSSFGFSLRGNVFPFFVEKVDEGEIDGHMSGVEAKPTKYRDRNARNLIVKRKCGTCFRVASTINVAASKFIISYLVLLPLHMYTPTFLSLSLSLSLSLFIYIYPSVCKRRWTCTACWRASWRYGASNQRCTSHRQHVAVRSENHQGCR